LARIKPQLEAQDFELIARLWSTLMLVMRLVRAQRTSIARLRRLFGLSSSEKTREVTGSGVEANRSDPEAAHGATEAQTARAGDVKVKGKPKGHGRLGVSDYPTALHHAVLHAELKVGERCPLCERGNLYALEEPARTLRIVGQPLLAAHCWDCQRLRCSGCGHVFTAQAPAEAQRPKFEETAVAMLASAAMARGYRCIGWSACSATCRRRCRHRPSGMRSTRTHPHYARPLSTWSV
jgi:transposase-like protein